LFEKTKEKLEDTFEKVKKTAFGESTKNSTKDSCSEETEKKVPAEALEKTVDAAEATKKATEVK